MKQARVFIVEDETKLAFLLRDYLLQAQFEVMIFHDGLEVVEAVKVNEPAAILLDLMLPGKDGIQICSEIRRFSQVPILMVTAKVEEIDRLLGLEIGADDYICKPFSPREVVARVKTVLRRVGPAVDSSKHPFSLDEARLTVNTSVHSAQLTAVEFEILLCLSNEPGRIFSRNTLMGNIYKDNRIVSDRTIDSHIKKLRKKLVDDAKLDIIRSVYGVGYKMEENVEN